MISRKIDGDISTGELNSIKRHLDSCRDCNRYSQFHQLLAGKVKVVPDISPSEVERRLRKIIPEKEEKFNLFKNIGLSLRPAFAAVMALLVVGSLAYITSKGQLKRVNLADNDEKIIQSLSSEERAFLINLDETDLDRADELMEMLRDMDELEDLGTEEKVNT